jgi:hypothetical protein
LQQAPVQDDLSNEEVYILPTSSQLDAEEAEEEANANGSDSSGTAHNPYEPWTGFQDMSDDGHQSSPPSPSGKMNHLHGILKLMTSHF